MTTIYNATAGQLSKQLDTCDWAQVTSLEVNGVINYNDWKFLSTLKTHNKLESLDLGKTEGLTQTGELDFPFAKFKSLERLVLPEGITTIDACSFDGCERLRSVVLPNSIKQIQEMAFRGCSCLADVCLPENLEEIGTYAFWGCSSLNNLKLPFNLKDIRNGAFANCCSLRKVSIPSNIRSISEAAFRNCTQLAALELPRELQEIRPKAFQHCMRITDVLLPNTLLSIGEEAFKGCIKLRNINLPAKLHEIGKKAFEDCSSLVSVALHYNIKTLPGESFRGCSHLERLEIASAKSEMLPNGKWKYVGLQKIGEEALRHCRSLSVISLPASLKMIESHAFRGCKMVQTIECLAPNPPMVMPNSFAGIDTDTVTLVVPTQKLGKYRESEVWNTFKNIKGKDDSDMLV